MIFIFAVGLVMMIIGSVFFAKASMCKEDENEVHRLFITGLFFLSLGCLVTTTCLRSAGL